MKTVFATLAILALLFSSACREKEKTRAERIEEQLDALIAQLAPEEAKKAQEYHDKAAEILTWLEKHPEDRTTTSLKKAQDELSRRAKEGEEKFGDEFNATADGLLGWFKSIDYKKKADWIKGTDDPRYNQYKGPEVDPTDDRGPRVTEKDAKGNVHRWQ